MNRLAHSLSPYLLAHRDDPVDWQPWDQLALQTARCADRPILLSIGYASCHWCHVMQRESFQDEAIAAEINRHFVAIKVDREELPDVDQIYQSVCQAVTGQGGWPLTVFLTPELQPFHVGTYYPPSRRYGRPGFHELLTAASDAYLTRREEVEAVAESWAGAADTLLPAATQAGLDDPDDALHHAASAVLRSHDAQRGGFGGAPKFPQAPMLSLLLRAWSRLGDQSAEAALRRTLKAMASGGIYDQLAGGFHRYAVDAAWQVPHFEKMLEDQALLAPLYTALWQMTGETWALEVAKDTLAYVDEELSAPEGGFYISQDADSAGGEGAYYRFSPQELEALLGADAQAAILHYGLDDPALAKEGVLQHAQAVAHVAHALAESPEETGARLRRARDVMRAARRRRQAPGRDRKVLAGATGLAISAFARLGAATADARWTQRAERAAAFALETLRRSDGIVLRRFYEGQAGIEGYLEDYAGLGQGFLDLYLAHGDLRWLLVSLDVARKGLELFWDKDAAVLYSAPVAAATPLARPVDRLDGAKPAAQSRMLRLLLLLGSFDDTIKARDISDRVLQSQQALWSDHPGASPSLAEARDLFLTGPKEITIVAEADDEEAASWQRELRRTPLQDLLATWLAPAENFAIWQGKRQVDGAATLYACRLGVCSAPLHDLGAALSFLAVGPRDGAADARSSADG